MNYIVMGADGKLAGRVAEIMLKKVSGDNLTFTCYKKEKIPSEKLKLWEEAGVRIVEADYEDKKSLNNAFKNRGRLYFVSGLAVGRRVQQHKNVIDVALENGIEHITYTSFIGATEKAYENVYVTPDHTATENYLKESGIPYSALRHNMYMETYLTNRAMLAFMSGGKWVTTAGEGKATLVCKDDCANANAASLLGKGEDFKVYNITGEQSVSIREICNMISERSGEKLEYIPATKEETFEYLAQLHIPGYIDGDFSKSPVPFCAADMASNDLTIAEGLFNVKSNDVKILTGDAPKTVVEVIENYDYIWKDHITNWDQMK